MELEVFDLDFNNIGIIDGYAELRISIHYEKHSELSLIADATEDNLKLLKEDTILTKSSDLENGYIIEHVEFLDDSSHRLLVYAKSINSILNARFIIGQQSFSGNVEDVLKSFVDANAINPSNPNRVIPGLILGDNSGIDIDVEETAVDRPLDEFLYEVTKTNEISWSVTMNHEDKEYIFRVWQGVDRTTEQNENDHVMFSKELDNVLSQRYTVDTQHHKTTAIVAGEGDDVSRIRTTVNDELSGFDRKEVFLDARNMQRKYRDESGGEVTLTLEEYENALNEHGVNSLADYRPIRAFESEIDMYSQFEYGLDYFCGDKVTIENESVGIVMHTRIMSSIETYSRNGIDLTLDFGSSIPTLIDNIRRTVK